MGHNYKDLSQIKHTDKNDFLKACTCVLLHDGVGKSTQFVRIRVRMHKKIRHTPVILHFSVVKDTSINLSFKMDGFEAIQVR